MREFLSVGIGGFLGSVSRWGIGLCLRALMPGLPLGTLVANAIAALVIGLVTGLDLASPLPTEVRLFLAVGLCGGLSTFSTFSSETFQLAEAGNLAGAAANVVLNLAVCLALVWVGLLVARSVAAA
jgi:CrcB protein